METVYLTILVICLFPMTILAYHNGAGVEACYSLTPMHNTTAQPKSSLPYAIDVNTYTAKVGTAIKVTLRMKNSGQPYFEGFLVQARCVSCKNPDTTILPGTFTVIDTGAKPMTCGAKDDSITHVDDEEMTSMSFNWMPPANLNVTEGVQFRAAVVKDLQHWWTDVRSVALPYSASGCCLPSLMLLLVALCAAFY